MRARADEFLVSDEGALHHALAGRTLTIRTRQHAGPPGGEDTIDGELHVTVVRVKRAVVGLDAGGLFAGVVCVVEDDISGLHRNPLTFYADGTVADADDREVGRCDLTEDRGAVSPFRHDPSRGEAMPSAAGASLMDRADRAEERA